MSQTDEKDKEVSEVDLFFNEFSVSVNSSMVSNSNTSNKIGGGIGVYKVWRNGKHLSIINGLEYNFSSQLKNRVYENSNYAFYNDLNLQMHFLSIPVSVRYSFGKATKLFVEGGIFADINLGSRRRGDFHTEDADGAPLILSVNEEANLNTFDYGPTIGLGALVPVRGLNLLLKLDYKHGVSDLYRFTERIHNRYIRLSVGVNLN